MSQLILTTTGENRNGVNKSVRTYLFFVSPTGKEQPLKECPYLRKSWMKQQGSFGENTRILTVEYEATQPVILKLWTDITMMGKPKRAKSIFLEVGEAHPEIRLTGYDQFGEFRGHAKVLLNKSDLTVDQLEKDFAYEILKAPIAASNKSTRSLVFLRRK